ncbi:glutamate--tRNA ligase [Patescibacteria group bacterium]|nr:glutamate--tRNA ligase [Patescibacteria group bacterium]
MKVVTRFAPSPTGFMHIGGIRTALFAWLIARKTNGTFILRIEDTDKAREVAGSLEHIQESLQWLGLDWDYGPDKKNPFGSAIQSQRLDTYVKAAHELIAKGHAYPDPYTEAEVEAFRKKAEEERRPFLYRNHRPEKIETWDGKKPLRFRVPEIKRYKWNDAVRGELEAGEEALDDFILIKGDGYPTYNFAHIIDDLHMGVTHVFRADEFIASTPKFLSLYDALGIPYPVFVTLPPILGADGKKKLGKRDGAKDILEYRTEGYLPAGIVNFLALIGWNPGGEKEIFSQEELVQVFSIDQIQTHGGILNEEKLKWFNREHILKLPETEFIQYAKKFLSSDTCAALETKGVLEKLVPIMHERIQVFKDLTEMDSAGEWLYFAETPNVEVVKLIPKNADATGTASRLTEALTRLQAVQEGSWTAETVKNAVWEYAEAEGRGNVLWPLRFALSGKEKSPDPFTIAGIIGKDETEKRINRAIDSLS